MPEEDDWSEVWDARVAALETALGPSCDNVFHAPHPFQLGGNADVIAFLNHLDGAVYVTSELTGKPDSLYADYELMICHRSPDDWGPDIISRLAPYTQQSRILSGDTMDIDPATPPDSEIKALIFDTYATFPLFGEQYDLRLCLGITKAELQFKMDHGAEELLQRLKDHNIYPFTDLRRASINVDA